MEPTSAPVTETVTTTLYTWVDKPMIVALMFGFAGAVFVSIYFLRRRRSNTKP